MLTMGTDVYSLTSHVVRKAKRREGYITIIDGEKKLHDIKESDLASW